jgi:hypothetical protein
MYYTIDSVKKLYNGIITDNTLNEQSKYILYHIVNSIEKAYNKESKIDSNTSEGKEILDYPGMTGTKTRHLYNNLCSLENVKYLEIGTWYGSSSISAIYKNSIQATFIDNWSQFNGDPNILQNIMSKYTTEPATYRIIESDCWKVDTSTLESFNIYLYDGGHTEQDHYKALTYYINNLDNLFIFIVDDYNWPEVRDGTLKAIQDLHLHIIFRHEIFVSPEDSEDMPNHYGKHTWWNGCGIFLLKKPIDN